MTFLANVLCPERDAAAWETHCVVVLRLSPPGGSVQHLVHHRPGGPGPSLALHGGRGGHVHSGLCRMHRSSPGKHVSAQVCMFHAETSSLHAAVTNDEKTHSVVFSLPAAVLGVSGDYLFLGVDNGSSGVCL